MAKPIYHSSIEGAQHGSKGLDGFLAFAKEAGATGAQPSNYMLEGKSGAGFTRPHLVRKAFEKHELKLDGISGHCPFWVHTSAWTGTKGLRPFVPPEGAKLAKGKIEQWAEDYLLRLLDLAAALNIKILPMFWGASHGWELATGYPWGFWAGGNFDLVKEGEERFVKKTAKIRAHANSLGIFLAHEIHPGTAAMCAEEFGRLVEICDGDPCLTVNADPPTAGKVRIGKHASPIPPWPAAYTPVT